MGQDDMVDDGVHPVYALALVAVEHTSRNLELCNHGHGPLASEIPHWDRGRMNGHLLQSGLLHLLGRVPYAPHPNDLVPEPFKNVFDQSVFETEPLRLVRFPNCLQSVRKSEKVCHGEETAFRIVGMVSFDLTNGTDIQALHLAGSKGNALLVRLRQTRKAVCLDGCSEPLEDVVAVWDGQIRVNTQRLTTMRAILAHLPDLRSSVRTGHLSGEGLPVEQHLRASMEKS